MHRGELDIISRYPLWQFFGTCTFKEEPSFASGHKRVMGLLFRVAKLATVDFSRVVWVLRPESGEKTGRTHFHYLLRVPGLPASVGSCFLLKNVWENHMQQGMSRVYLYDASQHGAEYVSKCLSDRDTLAASQYELEKFARTVTPPILSNSLKRFARQAGLMQGWSRRTSPGSLALGKETEDSKTGYGPAGAYAQRTGAVDLDNATEQAGKGFPVVTRNTVAPWIKVLR